MKTINQHSHQTVTGALSRKKMTIAANAKMFRQLISGIYSDKAYAIARELFGNYWDAHVLAGNTEKPCEVHVPTVLEPYYALRDFGISMTHELIETTYTSLGDSTKDDPNSDVSDTLVGKFGLGSKSPFAYVDSFQLTCFLDGEVRHYDCFLGEDGPEAVLMHVEETDEPNGVLVQFPVDPSDIPDFERALRRAWEALNVDPIFTGKQLTKVERTIVRKGTNWRLQNSTQSGHAEARQGTVLYPLNAEAVINIPNHLKPLCSASFVFDFPIGQLDITTSREALSYDQQTSANIITALQAALDEIATDYRNQLKAAKTFAEFCDLNINISSTGNNTIDKLLRDNQPTFKGRKPTSSISLSTKSVAVRGFREADDGELIPTARMARRLGGFDICRISGYDWSKNKINGFRKNERTYKDAKNFSIHFGRDLLVVLEDESAKRRMSNIRMKTLAQSFDQKTREGTDVLWLRHWGLNEAQLKMALLRIHVASGHKTFEVRNLLDVPYEAPARASYTRSDLPPRDSYKIINAHGQLISPHQDLTGKVFYVPLFSNALHIPNCRAALYQVHEALGSIIPDGGFTLIGIPASKRHLINKNSGWLDAHAFIQKKLEAKFNPGLFALRRTTHVLPSGSYLLEQAEKLRDLFGKKRWQQVTEGRSIGTLLALYERSTQVREQLLERADNIHELIGLFLGAGRYHELLEQADKVAHARRDEINALLQQVQWEYPMIELVNLNRLAVVDRANFLNQMSEIFSAPRDSIIDIAKAA